MQTKSDEIFVLKGSSWIRAESCGCDTKGLRWDFNDLNALYGKLLDETVIKGPIENFKRFDSVSKKVTLSIALALHDAGHRCSKEQKQGIALLGTGCEGAVQANKDYFQDYVESGRKIGRGNLFIYTLASSPLAEAAIHFGLQGPLLYVSANEGAQNYYRLQERLIGQNPDVTGLLAIEFNAREATCAFKRKACLEA